MGFEGPMRESDRFTGKIDVSDKNYDDLWTKAADRWGMNIKEMVETRFGHLPKEPNPPPGTFLVDPHQ
jgi:hypothetical protein